jgi:hypothetical protein
VPSSLSVIRKAEEKVFDEIDIGLLFAAPLLINFSHNGFD